MYYFWPTVFLALVVFLGRLPATVRRVRAQREALRPVPPVTRADHFPCMLNAIGAALTEFFMLGLMTFAVFILSNAAVGTFWQAPSVATGIRHFSLGTLALMLALGATIAILLKGGALARMTLLFGSFLAVIAWMVLTTTGADGPAILLFALLAVGAPAVLVALLRRLL